MAIATPSSMVILLVPGATLNRREEILVGWFSPPTRWAAVNSSGAYRGTINRVVAKRVLKDSGSTWLGGYACSLGKCTAYRVELWGVYSGLCLA
ncbi:Uncharacterized protein TCM_027357 [Theobroma cacao]|uniref:Uncharacterized protein n=1 Tax=Theobroma cacao TaxID=3641 RepID=A0A061G8T6_THECC|nr:Uncharacterized protein TCM_027357 [Theobroma cacao]